MKRKLAIIGAGDLGVQIAHHASTCGYEVVGYFCNIRESGTEVHRTPILGPFSSICEFYEKKFYDSLVCGIGYQQFDLRKKVFNDYSGVIPFAKLIHPNTILDRSVEIGDGSIVLAGNVLDMNVRIGNNVFMNVSGCVAHDSVIGDHSFLAPAVRIAGMVRIGESCFLGIGSVIKDNIDILSDARIGAGAVVVAKVERPKIFYIGVPAKPIRNSL